MLNRISVESIECLNAMCRRRKKEKMTLCAHWGRVDQITARAKLLKHQVRVLWIQ